MTFPEFLESRIGNTVGYAFMGAVTGAVGWPLFVAWQFPRAFGRATGELLTAAVQGEIHLTWEIFLHVEIVFTVLGAGIGAIHGARMGALVSGVAGFVLGILVELLAIPLGLYADFNPQGVSSWLLVLGVFLSAILGLIIGGLRARGGQMEHEQSLDQIRKNSRRR